MENHHAINGKIHYKWPFSIAMLNYRRVWANMGEMGIIWDNLTNFVRNFQGQEALSLASTGHFAHSPPKLWRFGRELSSELWVPHGGYLMSRGWICISIIRHKTYNMYMIIIYIIYLYLYVCIHNGS